MQNALCVSWAVEVMDKVVFKWWKPMKPRHLTGSRKYVVCLLN
jgi:hypothetical protein